MDYWKRFGNTLANKGFYGKMFGYAMTFIAVIILLYVLLANSININFVKSNYNTIVMLSLLFATIFIVYAVTSNFLKKMNTGSNQLIAGTLALVWGVLFYQNYLELSYETSRMIRIGYFSLIVLTILIGLTIAFSLFGNYLRSLDGILGFVAYFIFYIPCMLYDLFQSIMKELKMTSKEVYVLYVIEAVLFFMLFYFHPMVKSIASIGGKEILYDPLFLNIEVPLASYEELKGFDESVDTHSLSFWVYMNHAANSNPVYANGGHIISLGNFNLKYKNNLKTGEELVDVLKNYNKDNVEHTEKINELQDGVDLARDSFIFEFGGKVIEEQLPSQRWNNIVINRNLNNVDVFINGEYVSSIIPNATTSVLASHDRINIGQEGLSGAICNIRYFREPQSKTQIASNYNLYSVMNPPII